MREADQTTTPTGQLLPSTTRRKIMEGIGGASLLAIAAAAFARPDTVDAKGSAPGPAAPPDAELIAVCTEFSNLERQVQHLINVQFRDDDDAGDAAADPLQDQQAELLERMCAMRATTPEGFKARAVALALYTDDPGIEAAGWNDQMLSALLRDMTAGEVA